MLDKEDITRRATQLLEMKRVYHYTLLVLINRGRVDMKLGYISITPITLL